MIGKGMNKTNLDFLKNMAKGITSVFGERCEVVIHDFSDLKASLVHIEGEVTNRSLNSTIPDMLYRLIKEFGDEAPDKFGYKSTTEDGKILKCSTHMVRNDEGKLEGCICINFNVTDFAFLASAFACDSVFRTISTFLLVSTVGVTFTVCGR